MSELKYKIYTLGCKVNQCDSRRLGELLAWNNWRAVAGGADLAVVNTCAVTKTALAKDQSMINRARKENPQAKIAVMGCWPKAYHPRPAGVDLLWGVRNLHKLSGKINRLMISPTVSRPAVNRPAGSKINKFCDLKRFNSDKSRYFIKVQDGCNQFCSYCIIPFTRGRLRSRSEREILAELKKALAAGYGEIVLSGIHLGLYGADFKKLKMSGPEKINLTGLLKKILALPGLGRARLSSIEITEVTDELISFMKKNEKMCRHLHISLQSGCDKILRLMNRPYSVAAFAARVKKIRRALPDISLTTDIIVGFPGETAADFAETYNFAKKMNFAKIHVFSFSAHEKTAAFNLPHRVGAPEIARRSEKLRILSKKMEAAYKKSILESHKKLAVVVENQAGGRIKGKTEFYFDVYFGWPQIIGRQRLEKPYDLLGKIIKIKLQ